MWKVCQTAVIADEKPVWGADVTVWHHAVIEENVFIGNNSVIGSSVFIGKGTHVGANVHIQHGAFIARNSVIEDDVFIGPLCALTDDKYPKAGAKYKAQPPVLRKGCSLGAGSVILPGVTIGRFAVVGAGAVVTAEVIPYGLAIGVPAKQMLQPGGGMYEVPTEGFGLP